MAIKVNGGSAPASISSKPLTVDEVRDRLTATAVATVRAIVKDNEDRMARYKDKGNIQLLASGPFYGNEYFKALQATSQTARLKYYLEKGSFFHGLAPSEFFYMQPNALSPTQVVASRFLLKPGKKPSEALAAIRQGLSFIGCGETCKIGYYEAIREVLGTEKFDMLFASDSPTPLMIHFDSFDSRDNPLLSLFVKTIPASKISKGQIVPIPNADLYPIKHLNGEASNFVTLCCDDTPDHQTFTTLGLRSEGMTLQEVSEKLLEEFNSDPIGMEIVTKEVAARLRPHPFTPMFAQKKLTPDEFAARGGGRILGTIELNAERITKLANGTFDEARALLTQWHQNK